MNLYELPLGDQAPDVVTAVIEIPTGSHNKYEYDHAVDAMRLDRVLHSPLFYPLDYGFLPRTLAEDGDPLDVIVLTDAPVFPGCIVEIRPIGIMSMIDGGERDDKVLAVQKSNPHYSHITELEQIAPHLLDEIAHFFSQYKFLEKKEVQVDGWQGREVALAAVRDCARRYAAQS
jgi:inorganic pyrophosphatase